MIFAGTVAAQEQVSSQQPAVSSQKPDNQLPPATTMEFLPDGSYLVSINGQTYKALPEDYLRDIMQSLEELDRVKLVRGALEKQIAIYENSQTAFKTVVATADRQTGEEARIAAGYKRLWEGEHNLRVTAEQLRASTQPRGLDKVFSHPLFKVGEKIAKPIFETWWNGRNRQTTVVMTYDQVALLRSQQRGVPIIVLRQ